MPGTITELAARSSSTVTPLPCACGNPHCLEWQQVACAVRLNLLTCDANGTSDSDLHSAAGVELP